VLELPLLRRHRVTFRDSELPDTIPERRQDPGRRYGTKTSLRRVHQGLFVDATTDCDGVRSSPSELTR
jgi:hypothetical protein